MAPPPEDDKPDDAANAVAPKDETPGAPGTGDDEDDFGYRRSRRQKLRGDALPGPGDAADKPMDKPLTAYDAFMQQHWESWLQPVLLIVLCAGGYATFKFQLLSESIIGIILSGILVGSVIYFTALPAFDLIQRKSSRTLFGILVLLWAFSSGYPTLRKSVPKQVLGQVTLTEANKTAKVQITGPSTGPFELTVSGKLKSSGNQSAEPGYDITVTGEGGGSDTVSGGLKYQVLTTRSRKGTNQIIINQNQRTERLSSAVHGREITISVDHVDDLMENGLDVQINPRAIDPWLFRILGMLVVLCLMLVEATVGDSKTKTHLVMASMGTVSFAWQFCDLATSTNLVRPAVDALFVGLLIGGIGGTIVGWAVRRISGRDKVRPREKEKDREKEKA